MAAFLVPGPNLVRPLAVVRELWNASDPRHPPGSAWRRSPPPARVYWWWALLVAALAADLSARALALRSGGILDFGPAMRLLVVAQLLTAAAAVVGVAMVLGIDWRQDEAAWQRAPGGRRP